MHSNPLMSIVVMTYNSSKYVIETLDSAYNQTYPNIELIVTDDCSSDDTVKLVDIWIGHHRNRFLNCQLITSSVNSGIPANINKGIRKCKGEWVKIIAGDDILLPKCIENLITYIRDNAKADIVIGKIKPFYFLSGNKKYKRPLPRSVKRYIFSKESDFQYHYLLERSFNIAPGAFIKRGLYDKIGFYDEKYKMLEDLPFWIKATRSGIRLYLINKPCVQYRTEHESAVFAQKHLYNKRFVDCLYQFHRNEIWNNVPFWKVSYYESILIDMFVYYIGINIFNNSKSLIFSIFKNVMQYLRIALYYEKFYDMYHSGKVLWNH